MWRQFGYLKCMNVTTKVTCSDQFRDAAFFTMATYLGLKFSVLSPLKPDITKLLPKLPDKTLTSLCRTAVYRVTLSIKHRTAKYLKAKGQLKMLITHSASGCKRSTEPVTDFLNLFAHYVVNCTLNGCVPSWISRSVQWRRSWDRPLTSQIHKAFRPSYLPGYVAEAEREWCWMCGHKVSFTTRCCSPVSRANSQSLCLQPVLLSQTWLRRVPVKCRRSTFISHTSTTETAPTPPKRISEPSQDVSHVCLPHQTCS